MALMIIRDTFGGCVGTYLGLIDLAQVQAVDRTTRVLLDASSVWSACISLEMPELDIAPELLRAEKRPLLVKHLPALLYATFAEDVKVKISNLEEAERIGKLVTGARRTADKHTSSGGGAACVAVAKLRFPREELPKAMEGVGPEDEFPSICVGAPIRFKISEELATALNSPSVMLEIYFAWEFGRLLVKVQDVFLPEDICFPPNGESELTTELAAELSAMLHEGETHGPLVDVSVRHPAFTLHQRGGVAEMGGDWKPMGPGLTSVNAGKAAAYEALSDGILCTVCVREGRLNSDGDGDNPPKFLAHALHLDQVRSARF